MTAVTAEDRERVGPYRVIQAIGAGGSARIDLARIDRAYGFQRHVVIKRPLEHLRGNASVAAQLRREARIGGQLRHPNLVAVLDAGVHDGYDYLVLEYIHGAALRTLMQTDTPGKVRALPLAVALAIVSDVARGMHEAHELSDEHGAPLGLVHRDVSPGNVLLGLDGTVKLADFGIAKETRVATLSGSMHGTVTYMAPEQCQGHAFDRRADVFSLGVILYELVTGTRLFWADNDVASLHRVLSGTVPRPRTLQPQIAPALEDILMTAVAHDAGQRYPTALELAGALERHAAGAGEVLGARWIARTMEELVGARQVPWLAAATMPEAAPRSDASLVDLIAATEPDEPVSPSFGDAGDVIGDEPGVASTPQDERASTPATRAPAAAVGPEPAQPAQPAQPIGPAGSEHHDAPPARTPRRGRTLAAGLIALAVIGGGAATAIVVTQGSAPATRAAPPSPSPAPPVPSTASPTTPSPQPPPASSAASASASAGPPPPPTGIAGPDAAATSPPPPTGAAGPEATAVSLPPAPNAGDDAPTPETRHAGPPPRSEAAPIAAPPRSTGRTKHHATASPAVRPPPRATDAPAGEHAQNTASTPAGPPVAGGAGSGSAQPSGKPPPNVEWKPTLLLPTDPPGAKAPK